MHVFFLFYFLRKHVTCCYTLSKTNTFQEKKKKSYPKWRHGSESMMIWGYLLKFTSNSQNCSQSQVVGGGEKLDDKTHLKKICKASPVCLFECSKAKFLYYKY